jgi:hypothetical protein
MTPGAALGLSAFQARAQERAVDLGETVKELQAAGCESLRAIAAGLEGRGIPTARGGNWSAVQVSRLLGRLQAADKLQVPVITKSASPR